MTASGEFKVAVVGLGFGANHARVLSGLVGVRLTAVCDTDENRLAAGSQGREVHTYSDYAAMFCQEKLDAVIVATPAGLHEPVALSAIEAGFAVLVEKPLAPSLAEGRRLAEAAALAGVPLMTGHIERFNPALTELAKRVRAGDIGRVLQITARRAGAIRVPPTDVNVVYDSALHEIDAMRFVLGSEVEEVTANAQSGIVADAENAVLATLRFEPVDGVAAIASLEVNWLSPRRLRDLAVLGEKGLFVLDYAAQTLELHKPPVARSGPVQGWSASRAPDEEGALSIFVEPKEQLILELAAFVEAVRHGKPMPVTSEDALAALAVADALTKSARTRKSVRPERWSFVD
jgi:UDP-N-acetylglucosamine 3-dehydrogenase